MLLARKLSTGHSRCGACAPGIPIQNTGRASRRHGHGFGSGSGCRAGVHMVLLLTTRAATPLATVFQNTFGISSRAVYTSKREDPKLNPKMPQKSHSTRFSLMKQGRSTSRSPAAHVAAGSRGENQRHWVGRGRGWREESRGRRKQLLNKDSEPQKTKVPPGLVFTKWSGFTRLTARLSNPGVMQGRDP